MTCRDKPNMKKSKERLLHNLSKRAKEFGFQTHAFGAGHGFQFLKIKKGFIG
jgi:hypothetical protein